MTEIITSSKNPDYKNLKKLASSQKQRQKESACLAEGVHLAQSFLASLKTPLAYAYPASALKNPEVTSLIKALNSTAAREVRLADSLFESLTSLDVSSGILLVFRPPLPNISIVTPLRESAVVLQRVQDPGNLGTMLRTTAAVGIKNVLLSGGCTSAWSPKALRAGMGAQFYLNIYEDVDIIKAVSKAAVATIASTLDAKSLSLYEADLGRPVAWIFGNEGEGLDEEIVAAAKLKINVPQDPASVESLNVAAAAAVCLYEQYRQNNFS